MAASRKPLDWFDYQVGMHSFRAFAQGKPTWILNYSWDGEKNVDRREAMKNLAMSEVMANANFWDAPGHSMAGSNDRATRREIFAWIKANEKTLFDPRVPISPIGVYFSPKTRDYYANDFITSYRGILILLMQKHLEFQVVTPRTLAAFQGNTLVIPSARVISDDERVLLRNYAHSGKTLVITGEDRTQLDAQNVVRFSKDPGAEYYAKLQQDFDSATPDDEKQFFDSLKPAQKIHVLAAPSVVASMASVDGRPQIFFANFTALRGGINPVQTPQTNVKVVLEDPDKAHGFFLPFLGQLSPVTGVRDQGKVTFTLPAIQKGAVFWWEP
ncbi:MAG: hypothetical protein JOZ14_04385 [Acidobacteria bacterium]|nr:hypothetical protein [Acidobacteriota bacterium]